MKHLRRLLPDIRRHWLTYAGGFLCVILSNYFITLVPTFVQAGIDAANRGRTMEGVYHALRLLLGAAVLGGLFRYGMRELLNSVSRKVETDLRNRLFGHLQRLSAEFYDRFATGDLMARSTNDLLAVRMVAGPAVMYLSDTLFRAVMVMPKLLHISPHLTGIALLPLIGLPVGMVVFGRAIHRRTERVQAAYSDLTTAVHENLSGTRIIRAYRQEAAETERFRSINTEYATRNLSLARVSGAFHPMLALLGGLGAVTVIWVGAGLVMQDTITVGDFAGFNLQLVSLVWPMIALGWAVNLVQRGEASMGRINVLFDSRPAITSPAHPEVLVPGATARTVEFDRVWFRFPNAHDRGWVLQDVSFRVPAGGALGVVGATGAGKSTVADLLVRTYDPDQGRILIDGVDLRALSLGELHRAVGMVPQETFLFSDTVRHNVLLGAPDDGRLERVAETSQLAAAIPDLPKGYDTMLGERGARLSGGQRQRAAIARALAQDPPVFVLDDSLSAVDTQTEARILHGLRSALASRTRIIISHRLSAVRDADQIIVLDAGKVVESGTHEVLMAAKGRYWELLRRQETEEELEAV